MQLLALKNKLQYLLAALLLPALWSCTDESLVDSGETSLVIDLAIPQGGSRAAGDDATSSATANECKINDLRVIAFPQGSSGHLLNQPVQLPTNTFGSTPSVEMRVDGITPGNYRIFVIANMSSKVADVKTEDELRAVIMNYGGEGAALPQPGNLPMVYEPTSITTIGSTPVKVLASMEIACVKVSLNVIFDKASYPETATLFGDKGLRIKSVTASKVSKSATLLRTERVLPDNFTTTVTGGVHYATYTRNDANATVNDRDVMSGFEGGYSPSQPSQKWCYHTVVYLPERYVTNDDEQTVLTLNGEIFGADGTVGSANGQCTFYINLGHEISGKRQLPRDTYYEVVGVIKSYGLLNVNSFMSVKPWSEVTLDASIRRTILSVDKTKALVKSLEPAVINYTSTASNVTFYCPPTVNNMALLIAENDAAAGKFTIKVNPEVPISSIAQRQGTVTVALKANNVTKYIDVDYDITPFFEVDETDHVIYVGDLYTKIAHVTTNLDDIKFPWTVPYTIQSGSCKVKVNKTKVGNGQWNITMELVGEPAATTTMAFEFGPTGSDYNSLKKTMNITVKPKLTAYRIYMRAINDRSKGTWPGTGEFNGVLAEDTGAGNASSNNWDDGWKGGNTYSFHHRIYTYYQYGESGGTDEIPQENVWYFSALDGENIFSGDQMTQDLQNPGWYYKDYSLTANGKNLFGKADHRIKPGETLIIFHSHDNVSYGCARHRFTHHMDPGITLFDYDDYEGWYLYDPTSDPYYRIYDNKPEIVNVTYSIYTKTTVSGWYRTYGAATNANPPEPFTIYSNSVTLAGSQNGWNKYTITLKAPKGEYEKAIQIKFGDGKEPVLFDGNSWTTGYYSGGKWYNGKPSGVTI